MKTDIRLWYLAQFFLEWEMFKIKVADKIETHFMFSNILFENRFTYEKVWRNTGERGRPQMTIWRMRIACLITKATNTHLEYVILTTFPLQQLLHECTSMLRYTYISCSIGLPKLIAGVLQDYLDSSGSSLTLKLSATAVECVIICLHSFLRLNGIVPNL